MDVSTRLPVEPLALGLALFVGQVDEVHRTVPRHLPHGHT